MLESCSNRQKTECESSSLQWKKFFLQQMKPCLIAHIHCTKTTYLVRTSMWAKSIGLPDTPTFNAWKNKNPKVDPYLRVKKISNMHWEPVKSPQRKTKRMPWLQLLQDKSRKKFWQSIRKNKKNMALIYSGRQNRKWSRKSLSCGNTLRSIAELIKKLWNG